MNPAAQDPVAQVSNLLYRRFPIGGRSGKADAHVVFEDPQVGNLRDSRLETCATGTELSAEANF